MTTDYMDSIPEAICPLCSEVFPREDLYEALTAEAPRQREKTIRVIQTYHPGWVPDDGACPSCWKSHRDAGRILGKIQRSRPARRARPWEATPPARSGPVKSNPPPGTSATNDLHGSARPTDSP